MEGITPLFIYISSCDKYYREKTIIKIQKISIVLIMEYEEECISFDWPYLDENLANEGHRISTMKSYYNDYYPEQGCFDHFTKPFTMFLLGNVHPFLTEEERLEYEREIREEEEAEEAYYSDSGDNDDEEKEELSINDFKTFKLEQCVICLEEEPKVLFCNCGHLCICEKCLVHRYDNCPVCKKENTILRIIE